MACADARRGQGEQAQVLGLEVVGLLRLDIDDADDAVLDDQRNCQLGAHAGIDIDVVLGLADVVDQNGLRVPARPVRRCLCPS